MRILIIEDELKIADVIASRLRKEQYVVDVFDDGEEGLDNALTNIYDYILNGNKEKTTRIGNLYFDEYSYLFKENNSLTIIDNSRAKAKLINLLKTSIMIFVLLEIVIIIVSVKITRWIIKPVEESFSKQKQFVTDASHELKTPVAVIMANAEALEKEPNETKWLDNIKSESERMNGLISDLLDLAKLENGTNKENYKEEDLSKIVEKSLLTFESLIYENKIKLDYDLSINVRRCRSRNRNIYSKEFNTKCSTRFKLL